jgi:penicillin-binding protein 2
VANSGTVYNYTLLDHVEDSEGNILETYAPKVRNTIDVLDDSQWDAIHSGMRMVVEDLSTFDDFPVEVAGKTGTAQQDLRRANHALFVSYAPYENPQISIATRIAYGYTSHNAAEYAKNVYAYYFDVQTTEELLNGQAEEVSAGSNSVTD